MSQEDLSNIKIAENRIKSLEQLNEKFLSHLKLNGSSENFNNSIEIENKTIASDAFGKKIYATPRIVRDGAEDFAIEYKFIHQAGKIHTDIWVFYLKSNGFLVSNLNIENSRFCDFNNSYIADHLLTKIGVSVLQSDLFSPSQSFGS